MVPEHGFKALKGDLKYLVPLAVSVFFSILFVDYYVEVGENERENRYFIKRYPTFQIEFRSLYSHPSWDYDELTVEQQKELIVYCKFRWSIDADLDRSDELKACSSRKF